MIYHVNIQRIIVSIFSLPLFLPESSNINKYLVTCMFKLCKCNALTNFHSIGFFLHKAQWGRHSSILMIAPYYVINVLTVLWLSLILSVEAVSLEESSVWVTHGKSFEMWICPLVYSLIVYCNDVILRYYGPIKLLKC